MSTNTASQCRFEGTLKPKGDLIMIVGPAKVELRVDSKSLKNASPEFRFILWQNFANGKVLSDTGTSLPKIELPEDDPTALAFIFTLVHGYKNAIPVQMSAKQIYRVAVLADKYDMIQLVKTFEASMFLDVEHADVASLWKLAQAAYLLGSSWAFQRTTGVLVWKHATSFSDLTTDEDIDSKIIMEWSALLGNNRTRLRKEFLDFFLSAVQYGYRVGPICNCHVLGRLANGRLLSIAHRVLPDASTQSLAVVVRRIEELPIGSVGDELRYCKDPQHVYDFDVHDYLRLNMRVHLQRRIGFDLSALHSG